ncbi:hypothetical protein FRC04_008412 [Tulasnella sp. 424]|nr:hypothetical protein FRC04_008412 [Tulasnella sp. 424]KAG8976782.1 hypothetical protein FRC05_003132 [Tulasnella sp. 425]
MGLQVKRRPLCWLEAKNHFGHIKEHGITQLLNIWENSKSRSNDPFLWGEEIECMLIAFDDEDRNAKLALDQEDVLPKLQGYVDAHGGESETVPSFQPEYGRHQIESTPGSPYSGNLRDFAKVEENMRKRRELIRQNTVTKDVHHIPSTLATFPRMGVLSDFTDPVRKPTKQDESILLPETEMTSAHPRYLLTYGTGLLLAFNLRTNAEALLNHILLDSVSFGPSSCSLQVTMQAADLDQARALHDALVPIAPILLALSAASPIFKGYLAEVDSRWDVLGVTCDDRTRSEKGEEPLKDGERLVPDSRWFPVKWYLSPDQQEFNDEAFPYDEQVHERLVGAGMDDFLAKHFASLYIRDPLFVFEDRLQHDDHGTSNEHFESIQSTVWQTLRFKLPPPGSGIGWRVEVRTMEVQLTDFENAAFAVFVVLLSRAMLKFGIRWGLPISKNTENLSRAQRRDAVMEQKFWFSASTYSEGEGGKFEEMTLNEIVNGKARNLHHPCREVSERLDYQRPRSGGLIGLIHNYLDSFHDEEDSVRDRQVIEKYLELIKRKADGSIKTTAKWIRDFVRSHPEYKHDSVVTQAINYDLLKSIDEM